MPPNTASRNESSYGIAIAGLLIATVFGGDLISQLLLFSSSKEWRTNKAEVTDIKIKTKGARMEYRYSFNEERFSNDRFSILSRGSLMVQDEISANYEVGDQIEILVNPMRPSQSTVKRGSMNEIQIQFLLPFLGLSFSAVGFYRIWTFKSRTRTRMVE